MNQPNKTLLFFSQKVKRGRRREDGDNEKRSEKNEEGEGDNEEKAGNSGKAGKLEEKEKAILANEDGFINSRYLIR